MLNKIKRLSLSAALVAGWLSLAAPARAELTAIEEVKKAINEMQTLAVMPYQPEEEERQKKERQTAFALAKRSLASALVKALKAESDRLPLAILFPNISAIDPNTVTDPTALTALGNFRGLLEQSEFKLHAIIAILNNIVSPQPPPGSLGAAGNEHLAKHPQLLQAVSWAILSMARAWQSRSSEPEANSSYDLPQQSVVAAMLEALDKGVYPEQLADLLAELQRQYNPQDPTAQPFISNPPLYRRLGHLLQTMQHILRQRDLTNEELHHRLYTVLVTGENLRTALLELVEVKTNGSPETSLQGLKAKLAAAVQSGLDKLLPPDIAAQVLSETIHDSGLVLLSPPAVAAVWHGQRQQLRNAVKAQGSPGGKRLKHIIRTPVGNGDIRLMQISAALAQLTEGTGALPLEAQLRLIASLYNTVIDAVKQRADRLEILELLRGSEFHQDGWRRDIEPINTLWLLLLGTLDASVQQPWDAEKTAHELAWVLAEHLPPERDQTALERALVALAAKNQDLSIEEAALLAARMGRWKLANQLARQVFLLRLPDVTGQGGNHSSQRLNLQTLTAALAAGKLGNIPPELITGRKVGDILPAEVAMRIRAIPALPSRTIR